MECPHNAVLLLCSSHDKGCRPYMCGTSLRYSNCLDQYNKAYSSKLTCPLCRSQVKGWTVVGPAREHLNAKRRNCTHNDCSFVGTYKELRKHVRADHHSCGPPREVDPTLEQKWRGMERERETEDVRSTIRSSTPGAVFRGDYHAFGSGGDVGPNDDNDDDGYDMSLASRLRRQSRVVSGRRRRR
ncbi:hypothetical protein PHJA_000854900 [Phtheirospermum japonicum]|uniref:Uncharacterized protein n=1 Tax=Phtheirospermum japonicum TaxID=374723 RepID=A0A830BYJ8_9LAMI|nr:hypothetical protein PHJA_000854900 [Phtheirospermum japonicum]